MTTAIIFDIILLALLFAAGIMLNKTWNEKEHYRCRVFDLTNGKEGSHLVKAPDIPCPPPPKKPEERMERVEWSEEDERNFADILALLRGGENCHYNTLDLFTWFKFLKERVQHQDRI